MRIVFLGTADIARPCLRALVSAGHEIAAVVTQPDRPRGRSGAPQPPPLKEEALELKLPGPILQPERLGRQTREKILALAPDAGVVVAYGQLLSREVLAVPRHGFLNVHASLLPRWRGAAPVQRAIQAGDAETGVTIMRVIPRLDGGPILAQRSTPIGRHTTSESMLAHLGDLGAVALIETLVALENGTARETPQDEALVTYAQPIAKEEGLIDWSRPAAELDRKVRAFRPWPGAYSFLHRAKGAPVRVEVVTAGVGLSQNGKPPGTVLYGGADGIGVACGDGGVLVLSQVKPAGKPIMLARDWVNGRGISVNETMRSV